MVAPPKLDDELLQKAIYLLEKVEELENPSFEDVIEVIRTKRTDI